MFTKKTDDMSLVPGSKGVSTQFERIFDFLKQFREEQFVAFGKSCLEKCS